MSRKRRTVLFVGLAVFAALAAVVALSYPSPPQEDHERTRRLMKAYDLVVVGMTPSEVEAALGCPPDQLEEGGAVELRTTTGYIGHTVTLWYVNGRVSKVEARTWRSRRELTRWERFEDWIGL
jgi:hypothetical protein